MSSRPPWSAFRAELAAAGFRPSRRRGQNFLLDENMVAAIARDAELEAQEFVLEVGAGCGFLSVHLARAGVRLLCVEIDPILARVARAFLAPFPEARLIECDVLASKHALAEEVAAQLPEQGPWKVVSNLPYAVAAPLLCELVARDPAPSSITVLVQHELAERIKAAPGSPDWGALSIRLQLDYAVRRLRSVPAGLFWPRPKVESAVVQLVHRPRPPFGSQRAQLLELVGELFRHRRQAIGRRLGEASGDREGARALLERLGIDSRSRAETLTPEELAALASSPLWSSRGA